MLSVFRILFGQIFDHQARRKFYFLTVVMVIAALLEMAGIGAVMGFMSIAVDPANVSSLGRVGMFLQSISGSSGTRLVFLAGLATIAILLASNGSNALVSWLSLRFMWQEGQRLAQRLLAGYLAQPYTYFMSHHSADLLKNIFTEIIRVVGNVIIPASTIVARGLLAVAIMAMVMLISAQAAIIALVILGAAYALIYVLFRAWLGQSSHRAVNARGTAFRIVSEALNGIREVKVFGVEDEVVRAFSPVSNEIGRHDAASQLLSVLPRYALETVAFGGLIVATMILIGRGQNVSSMIPILATLGFAGYRVMPALQQLYASITLLQGNMTSLQLMAQEVEETAKHYDADPVVPAEITHGAIRFEGVGFRYPGAENNQLSAVNLMIEPGMAVALIGQTGAGKSTLIDLLTGLIVPSEGRILIDGMDRDASVTAGWLGRVGYVPQNVFLLDASVAANIAFGVPADQIDMTLVRKAAQYAQIEEVVLALPDGYATLIGDKGGRLSGGQRQRLALARALYRQPKLLVLDEATSALDEVTELRVLETLRALKGEMTIVMISHRPASLNFCDQILVVKENTVRSAGADDLSLMEKA